MKVIIFDIDGVIIKSKEVKNEIRKNVFQKYGLYDKPGVKDILEKGINRRLIIEEVYRLYTFNKAEVFEALDAANRVIELAPQRNSNVLDFLENNKSKYMFFTNTALSRGGQMRVLNALGIEKYFEKLFAYEDGTKAENIEYVINHFNVVPSDILFIDDNINNIINVQSTGVHTLHFDDYDIDIEEKIKNNNFLTS